MKVKTLIEQLQEYDGEDNLIVAYWDKETVEGYGAPKMTKGDWEYVVDLYEDGEWHWQGSAGDDFVELARKSIAEAEADEG
jgi:hypothetical protein